MGNLLAERRCGRCSRGAVRLMIPTRKCYKGDVEFALQLLKDVIGPVSYSAVRWERQTLREEENPLSHREGVCFGVG